MSWHTSRMCAFDLETTGIDVETARIVTACAALVGGGRGPEHLTWLADPGIDIPTEASDIHGVTTERARAEGRPAPEVAEEITIALAEALGDGAPIVAMNATYDLTVLDREARRHGIRPLVDRIGGPDGLRVIDPYVIDKKFDQYRRGSRRLTALCQHYQVRIDQAHDAAADAIAAARVAWRLGMVHPQLQRADPRGLHLLQIGWAADQAAGLRTYFVKTPGKQHLADTVRPEWPLIPHQADAGEQA